MAHCYIVEFSGSFLETEKKKPEARGWPPHRVTIFLETERKKPEAKGWPPHRRPHLKQEKEAIFILSLIHYMIPFSLHWEIDSEIWDPDYLHLNHTHAQSRIQLLLFT